MRASVTVSCQHDNLAKSGPIPSKFELDMLKGNISDEFEFGRDLTKSMAARRPCQCNNLAKSGPIPSKFELDMLKNFEKKNVFLIF